MSSSPFNSPSPPRSCLPISRARTSPRKAYPRPPTPPPVRALQQGPTVSPKLSPLRRPRPRVPCPTLIPLPSSPRKLRVNVRLDQEPTLSKPLPPKVALKPVVEDATPASKKVDEEEDTSQPSTPTSPPLLTPPFSTFKFSSPLVAVQDSPPSSFRRIHNTSFTSTTINDITARVEGSPSASPPTIRRAKSDAYAVKRVSRVGLPMLNLNLDNYRWDIGGMDLAHPVSPPSPTSSNGPSPPITPTKPRKDVSGCEDQQSGTVIGLRVAKDDLRGDKDSAYAIPTAPVPELSVQSQLSHPSTDTPPVTLPPIPSRAAWEIKHHPRVSLSAPSSPQRSPPQNNTRMKLLSPAKLNLRVSCGSLRVKGVEDLKADRTEAVDAQDTLSTMTTASTLSPISPPPSTISSTFESLFGTSQSTLDLELGSMLSPPIHTPSSKQEALLGLGGRRGGIQSMKSATCSWLPLPTPPEIGACNDDKEAPQGKGTRRFTAGDAGRFGAGGLAFPYGAPITPIVRQELATVDSPSQSFLNPKPFAASFNTLQSAVTTATAVSTTTRSNNSIHSSDAATNDPIEPLSNSGTATGMKKFGLNALNALSSPLKIRRSSGWLGSLGLGGGTRSRSKKGRSVGSQEKADQARNIFDLVEEEIEAAGRLSAEAARNRDAEQRGDELEKTKRLTIYDQRRRRRSRNRPSPVPIPGDVADDTVGTSSFNGLGGASEDFTSLKDPFAPPPPQRLGLPIRQLPPRDGARVGSAKWATPYEENADAYIFRDSVVAAGRRRTWEVDEGVPSIHGSEVNYSPWVDPSLGLPSSCPSSSSRLQQVPPTPPRPLANPTSLPPANPEANGNGGMSLRIWGWGEIPIPIVGTGTSNLPQSSGCVRTRKAPRRKGRGSRLSIRASVEETTSTNPSEGSKHSSELGDVLVIGRGVEAETIGEENDDDGVREDAVLAEMLWRRLTKDSGER